MPYLATFSCRGIGRLNCIPAEFLRSFLPFDCIHSVTESGGAEGELLVQMLPSKKQFQVRQTETLAHACIWNLQKIYCAFPPIVCKPIIVFIIKRIVSIIESGRAITRPPLWQEMRRLTQNNIHKDIYKYIPIWKKQPFFGWKIKPIKLNILCP